MVEHGREEDLILRSDEQLRMIGQILERADRTPRLNPVMLVTWGLAATLLDLSYFIYYTEIYRAHTTIPAVLVAGYTGVALALAFTAVYFLRRPRSARQTIVDRQLSITFSVAAMLGGLVLALWFPRWIMAGPDYAIFWNAIMAMAMLTIGLQHRNRLLTAGGVVLVASIVVARFDLWNVDLYLALGPFAGLVVPGIVFALRGKRT